MTEREQDPHPVPVSPQIHPAPSDLISPEDSFAAAVIEKVTREGRKWAWLAREIDLSPNTLRSQIIDDPSRLKLRTARRLATVLDIPLWEQDAA